MFEFGVFTKNTSVLSGFQYTNIDDNQPPMATSRTMAWWWDSEMFFVFGVSLTPIDLEQPSHSRLSSSQRCALINVTLDVRRICLPCGGFLTYMLPPNNPVTRPWPSMTLVLKLMVTWGLHFLLGIPHFKKPLFWMCLKIGYKPHYLLDEHDLKWLTDLTNPRFMVNQIT